MVEQGPIRIQKNKTVGNGTQSIAAIIQSNGTIHRYFFGQIIQTRREFVQYTVVVPVKAIMLGEHVEFFIFLKYIDDFIREHHLIIINQFRLAIVYFENSFAIFLKINLIGYLEHSEKGILRINTVDGFRLNIVNVNAF